MSEYIDDDTRQAIRDELASLCKERLEKYKIPSVIFIAFTADEGEDTVGQSVSIQIVGTPSIFAIETAMVTKHAHDTAYEQQ
jgi:hypothetical protein